MKNIICRTRGRTAALLACACLLVAETVHAATPNVIVFQYVQPPETVLNPDGGLWNHVDLMTSTVDALRKHKQMYGDGESIGPMRLLHTPICLNPVGRDFSQCDSTNPYPDRILSPGDYSGPRISDQTIS